MALDDEADFSTVDAREERDVVIGDVRANLNKSAEGERSPKSRPRTPLGRTGSMAISNGNRLVRDRVLRFCCDSVRSVPWAQPESTAATFWGTESATFPRTECLCGTCCHACALRAEIARPERQWHSSIELRATHHARRSGSSAATSPQGMRAPRATRDVAIGWSTDFPSATDPLSAE